MTLLRTFFFERVGAYSYPLLKMKIPRTKEDGVIRRVKFPFDIDLRFGGLYSVVREDVQGPFWPSECPIPSVWGSACCGFNGNFYIFFSNRIELGD